MKLDYPMSRRNNQRQKQKNLAIERILKIARKQNLLRKDRQWKFFSHLNDEFEMSTLREAWERHFDESKPSKAEERKARRDKEHRITENRYARNTRPPVGHNPGRHVSRHGSAKNAKAIQQFRESRKPKAPKNKKGIRG
jgi:hypothetical protein